MKKIALIVVLLGLFIEFAQSQSASDSLTMKLEEIAKASEFPGFAVAVVSKDSILYKKGFGYANLKDSIPFSAHTVLNIGSITKTLIGVSLMILIEEGKLSLDADINNYLPFKVSNPHYPNSLISIRHLATHTSSLTDGKDDMLIERSYLFRESVDFKKEELPQDYYPYFQIYKTNKDMSMGEFLEDTYSTSGKLYSNDNFLKAEPGVEYNYTNLGATLLAFIIEQVSQTSFSTYSRQEIMYPLGMNKSYWSLDEIPKNKLAALYMSNGLSIPHYSLITYPDGGLFTSVSDFSYFLIDMIQGMNNEGRLLKSSSYLEMMSNQLTVENFPTGEFDTSKGLMWSVNRDGDNVTMNGADPGIATYTLFTTSGNVGILIFINKSFYGNDSLTSEFNKIRGTLFQNIRKLLSKK